MNVKVTWKGEGQPEGGVLEYGYGTDHPKIPQGITRQKDDPDSNWEFQYIGQDTSSLKLHKYLAQPVWFYTSGGSEFYAADRSLIPADAENVTQGTYADAYRKTAEETRSPSAKSPLADTDKSAYAREKKLLDTLAKTSLDVLPDRRGQKNAVSIVPNPGGSFSLLSLYLFAIKTGNDSLVSQINSWAGKKTALMLQTADLFGGDPAVMDLVRDSPALPIAQAVCGAKSWKELNSTIAKVYITIQSKLDGFEEESITPAPAPQTAPARAIPEVLVQPEIVPPTPTPPPTPEQVMESKVEFVPDRFIELGIESTDFSRRYASADIDSGLHYIRNVPDNILADIFNDLSANAKRVLSTYLSGFVKKTENGYRLIPKEGRNFKPSYPLSKAAVVDELMGALAELESNFNKRNVEFEVSTRTQEYSPLLTMDFPYMWALGRESEGFFAALQGAFVVSLKNEMRNHDAKTGTGHHAEILEDLDSDWSGYIQLTQVHPDVVVESIRRIWDYTEYTRDGERVPSPLGVAIRGVTEKTGKTGVEIKAEMTNKIATNLKNLAYLKAQRATSQGLLGSKSMDAAGRAMGIVVSAHTAGLKNRLLGDKENSLMYVSQHQFGKVLEQLLGERTEVGLGDTVTYHPSAPGRLPMSFSLGLLQYQHNYMPYYFNEENKLIVEVAGDEYNLTDMEEPERGKVLDAFMDRVVSLCNTSKSANIDSQDAIFHSLQKYQHGLYTEHPEEASTVLGGRKSLGKVKSQDDVHNDSAYLQTVVDVVSSITNFIATDAEKWLRGGIPESLSPEEVSSVGGEPHLLVAMAFQKKIDAISLDMPSILEALEIPDNQKEVASQLIIDALLISKESASDKLSVKEKGKLNTTQLGNIMEYTQVIVPALSAMRNAALTGQRVEIIPGVTGRGSYHTGITPEMMSGQSEVQPPNPKSKMQSAFLRNSLNAVGFHLSIGGVDNFFLKETRTGGFGDLVHVKDPRGEASAYPFEGKTGKGSVQKPHLSQVSPMLRFLLRSTAGAKSVNIGKTGTVYLHYGEADAAVTPRGQLQSKKKAAMYFTPKFGVARQGSSTIDYDRMAKLFSASDGAALECVNYG